MNTGNSIKNLVIFLVLFLLCSKSAIGFAWDAKADWSDVTNPIGPWSYRASDGQLLQVTSAGIGGSPAGWSLDGTNTTTPNLFDDDWAPGGSQGVDEFAGHGPWMVRWTSPENAVIQISGSLWQKFEMDRHMAYKILHNGSIIAQGEVLVNGNDTIIESAGKVTFGPIEREVLAGDTIEYVCDGSGSSGNTTSTFAVASFQIESISQLEARIEFDGINDYVNIAGYKGITATQSRTVSAWIKTDTPGAIISWGSNSLGGDKWVIRVQNTSETIGRLRAEVNGGFIVGLTNIQDNICHHIAVVMDDDGSPDVSELQLYVDGKLETITSVSPQAINTGNSADVKIATTYQLQAATNYFTGNISDLRIYDQALNAAEIVLLANSPTPPAAGLVAHWKLDDDSPTTVVDSAGSNDGSIVDSPAWIFGAGYCDMPLAQIVGDINRDICIDDQDLLRLVQYWLDNNGQPPNYHLGADIDQDTVVDYKDFYYLSKNWQRCLVILRHLGYVVVSPQGPGDGGDFGTQTPGSATSGLQEAFNFAVANNKDVFIVGGLFIWGVAGPVVYQCNTKLTVPAAKNLRIAGGDYVMNWGTSNSDCLVFDSQDNGNFKFGLLVAQGPGINNGYAVMKLKPLTPLADGRPAIRNSFFRVSAPVGGGNVWGVGIDGKGTGLHLNASSGDILNNHIIVMEINACNRGIVLDGGGLIQNNYIESPFTHITNKLLDVYTGSFNLIEAQIDGGGTSTPAIGANLRGGTQNRYHLLFGSNFAPGQALVFGTNARDNVVRTSNLPAGGVTNNADVTTNRIIPLNTQGFNVTTPDILFSFAPIYNNTGYTILATVETEGNVASWLQFSSGLMSVTGSLYRGQIFYLEPGDWISFNFTAAPTWNWRALR